MLYSKKKISKAGEILMTAKSKEKRNEAINLINIWRSHHLHPLNVMKNALIRVLTKYKIKPVLISQRLKRLSSIEFKLDVNDKMGLGGMQDIGGFRAVLKDVKDLNKLRDILNENPFNHKLKKVNDYIENPKTSGYRSIHYIYTYRSKKDKYDGLSIELQIRTKLQHIWATAVETAGLITKTSLKSSLGPDDWLDFFKIISSLFAIKEKLPVLDIHKDKELVELMKIGCEYIKKLNVIPILKGLRISAKKIEIDKKGEYHIIYIDFIKKMVRITSFKKKDYENASMKYLEIEKEIDNSESAVVLVSSNSIKSLKKAYPSYFLDTSEFITALEKILQNCDKYNIINTS